MLPLPHYYKTILLVEDEENDSFLAERAFRKAGVNGPIHIVSSGSEAIAYLMGEGKYADRQKYAFPTFIVTDLKMPYGDGFEVLHHLKSNPQFSIVPTVVLTSSTDPDDVQKAYMLGASSFHVKPRSYDSLCQQMKVLHDYWLTCLIPEVDKTGRHSQTDSEGRMGERFPSPSGAPQTRHPSQEPKKS